ncbi:MAG: PilC/PilY family type IV pilus protein [Aquificaceae bacterium]|nr:PilC/PilY family type IV pilus protein [Aquificaceae bacterium]
MRRLLFFMVILLLAFTQTKPAQMSDYCYVPPFISNAVKPNVLIVMDFSGSMQFPAYVPCDFLGYTQQKTANCGTSYITSSSPAKYDTNKIYSGYFNPNKCYSYSGSNFVEANCDCSNKIGTSSCISGNLLNWISATRIDIARWVLTGGRSSSSQGNTFLISEGAIYTIYDSNLKCQFQITAGQPSNRSLTIRNYNGTCPLGNNAINNAQLQIRPSDPSSIKGIIHSFCDTSNLNGQINEKCQLIMEFMVFASDGRYGKIKVGKQATISQLINAINNELPYYGTPTGEALWEAYDFYKQSNDNNYEENTAYIGRGNGNTDPYYDGSGQNSYAVSCRKSFVLLLSDGAWNGNVDPVVPARIMATQDLRSDLPGKQNVYTYAVYAFGDLDPNTKLQGRQAMITTAIFGGFDDRDNNTWPYPFTNIQYPNGSGTCSSLEYTIRTNIQTPTQTYCNSRGVQYPLPQCNPNSSWDPKCAEWDTAQPPKGLPYNFYEADDAESLKSALLSAFADILKRASSGSTVATLSGRSQASQVVIQPYFRPTYPTANVELKWLGFLRSFWIDTKQNLREDTVESKVLNIGGNLIDKIFQIFFDDNTNETKASIVDDIDTCSSSTTKRLDEVIPVFDAGCRLAEIDPAQRKIYYNKGGNLTSFTTGEASNLTNIWKVCSNNQSILCTNKGDCGGNACVSADASCIIRYIRGEDNPSGCTSYDYVKRPRTLDVSAFCSALGISGNKVWKLGDIINSSPAIAGPDPLNNYHLRYNDQSYLQYIVSESYKKRPTVVAVGANDGMLHIFRVGYLKKTDEQYRPVRLVNDQFSSSSDLVGEEVFAFIPKNALPYLLWYGNQDYCHVPTVDYRVMIFDANFGTAQNPNWRTLLVGAMGFGGKAITTSSGSFSSSVFVLDLTDWLNNNLSGTPQLLWETSLPDGTLTLSFPAIAKVEDNWYVLVGSGPKHIDQTLGESYTNSPKVYIFNLRNGSLVATEDVNVPGASFAIGDIMPVDIDNDYNDDVAYFGLYGKKQSGSIFGALMRINFRAQNGYLNPNNWTVSQAFDFGNSPAPVFGAPSYTLDEYNNFWVFFGTGKYLSLADKTINYTNYLIGFKHGTKYDAWQSASTVYLSDLLNRTGWTTPIQIIETTQMCVCDKTGCSNREIVTDASGSLADEPSTGWYIRLSGEAIYSQPFVFGGTVNTLSAVLPQDICSMEGSSKLYSLYYKTGTPYPRPTVLSPEAVVNNKVQQSINLGIGIPPLGMPFQVVAGTGKEYQAYAQISTGGILKLQQQVTQPYEGRFLLWIEK